MSLADQIEALRRQHRRSHGARAAARPALHAGGRFARWHVADTAEQESDGWLLTYLDLITLLLAMLVVLLAVSQMPRPSSAAGAPVELVGTVAQAGDASAAWPDLPATVAAAFSADSPWQASAPFAILAPQPLPAPQSSPAPQTSDTNKMPDASSTAATPPSFDASPHPAIDPATTTPEPQRPSIADLGLDDLGDGVDVIVNEKSISFRISNELLFASGQAVLSASGLPLIQRMATVINRSQGYPVSVEGHSDPVPIQTRQFPSNWELSTSRATSVLRELVRDGVAPARLRAVGYADTHPIAANDTPAGRAANRRVELIMEITPRREAAAPDAGAAEAAPAHGPPA